MSQVLPILFEKKHCYDIVIDKDDAGFLEAMAPFVSENRKVCIITDSVVSGLYAENVKSMLSNACKEVKIFILPAGEENKNLEEVKKAYAFLIENKFNRDDLLIALGGGVVGDMTGYIAATYLRGVDFIQIPTTLLAQNDSSIGGKTGVDFDGYKNMIGAFHMPRMVYMNLGALSTLDGRQFYSGFAEVMKSALIKDARFYEWLLVNMYEIHDREADTMLEMVQKSCDIKRKVVESDPTEKGERAILNFGHTIGHAVEKNQNFSLTHGECVALGCVAAAYISWKKDLLSMDEYYEIRDMFVPFNLPITADHLDAEEILRLTKSDKKAESGAVKFILLKKIGKAVIDTSVTDKEIMDAVNEINYTEESAYE